jgi:hypothetical protein
MYLSRQRTVERGSWERLGAAAKAAVTQGVVSEDAVFKTA